VKERGDRWRNVDIRFRMSEKISYKHEFTFSRRKSEHCICRKGKITIYRVAVRMLTQMGENYLIAL
jgi:hypothetical protein